jgi:hypothetical protein
MDNSTNHSRIDRIKTLIDSKAASLESWKKYFPEDYAQAKSERQKEKIERIVDEAPENQPPVN